MVTLDAEVCPFPEFHILSFTDELGITIAGVGYELVASVCTKGKRCIAYLDTFFKVFNSFF